MLPPGVLSGKFLAERPGKIVAPVTCKAYLTVNADRLPKYNQHRVITDGHSETPKMIKARLKKPG